ncbi:cytosine permease, partial [Candidatus Burkholderia verschuerenii]|uniref:cytosine permease n=1 Tax=Candidatus Burkholderia verschuerenii TaxID=242163 RepID=UPI0018DB4503
MQQDNIGESDTYAPLLPVPPQRRAFGFSDAFALWFSLGIGLLVAQAGALLVPGLSLPHALIAIVVGTVIGGVLLALAGGGPAPASNGRGAGGGGGGRRGREG